MKSKKKGSSFKGLIFVLVILGLIGLYLFWYYTKSNLCLMVTVYKNNKVATKAEITVNGKKAVTPLEGMVRFDLRVDQGDTLLVHGELDEYKETEMVIIDSVRYNTAYTNADIVLDKLEDMHIHKYFDFGK